MQGMVEALGRIDPLLATEGRMPSERRAGSVPVAGLTVIP